MEGNKRVDELMLPVLNAINRHVKDRDAKTEIYNRAYEVIISSMDVMNMEISKLRSEVSALREQVRWIPVSERLPEDYENVLLLLNGLVASSGFHNSIIPQWSADGFYYHSNWYDTVTHWKPLPQPPEVE